MHFVYDVYACMTKWSCYWIDSGSDKELTDDSDMRVLAQNLIRLIENSILSFHLFLKRDKKKSSDVINLFGNQN